MAVEAAATTDSIGTWLRRPRGDRPGSRQHDQTRAEYQVVVSGVVVGSRVLSGLAMDGTHEEQPVSLGSAGEERRTILAERRKARLTEDLSIRPATHRLSILSGVCRLRCGAVALASTASGFSSSVEARWLAWLRILTWTCRRVRQQDLLSTSGGGGSSSSNLTSQ